MCSLCELTVAQSGVRGAGGYRKDGVAEQCGNGAVLNLSIAPFLLHSTKAIPKYSHIKPFINRNFNTYSSRDIKFQKPDQSEVLFS